MKKALITGINGQDGSYLTELLLEKGYEVHGILRPASIFTTDRIDHLFHDEHIHDKTLFLYWGDLTDSSNLNRIVEKVEPDEIYNLGAQSHVKVSFEIPEYTADVDALGRCVCLTPSKSYNYRQDSIRPPPANSSVRPRRSPKTSRRPSIPEVRMEPPKPMRIGS